ncbi:UNVERIFIED_CONTAM: hypothetical protein K2H54_047902 [Gekko kuhli]
MTRLLPLALLTCLASAVAGKIFGRCELAQKLKAAGLDGYRGYSLPNWICLAFYESHFDTGLVDHEADGSTSNGIFQINSHLWCDDMMHPSPNICDLHCSGTVNADFTFECAQVNLSSPSLYESLIGAYLLAGRKGAQNLRQRHTGSLL